ncbi:MAG: ROK family protein [Phycisphaerae bacterium]|nr:ROK family protein [Phycisphaerae bacterium]
MRILAIDIGGTKMKCMLSGDTERRVTPSGPQYTPAQFVDDVRRLVGTDHVDAVTVGFPAAIRHGRPAKEPVNLGGGWVDFDYRAAFSCPVKLLNDAAMQAVGSYDGGRMLFLGLGTGLGTTLIDEHHVVPLEAAHLPFRKRTFEDYVGLRGMEKYGKKQWREDVATVCSIFMGTLLPDYIVLGGGNAKELKDVPPGCRLGDNANAFTGGFRVWDPEWASSVKTLSTSD